MNFMKYKKQCILWVLLVAGLITQVIRIFESTVWADECYTIQLVSLSIKDIMKGTMQDFHPPLYYIITKIIVVPFDYSLVSFRLASIIPMLLLAYAGKQWMSEKERKQEGNIFFLLVLLSPIMYYGIEIRMYSWALLFVSLFIFSAIDFLVSEDKKNRRFMIVFGLLAGFTHYFALLMVAAVYLAILTLIIREKRYFKIREWIGCVVLSIIIYIPWIFVVIKQISAYESSGLSFNSALYYLKPALGYFCMLFGNLRSFSDVSLIEVVITVLVGILVLYFVGYYKRKCAKKDQIEVYLGYFLLFCIIICYVSGCVMDMFSHKFVTRYLYPSSGIVLMELSIIIGFFIKNKTNMWKNIYISAGIVMMIGNTSFMVFTEYTGEIEEENAKIYFQENIDENDLIITDSRLYKWIVLEYNFNNINYELCLDEKNLEDKVNNNKKFEDIWFLHNENDGEIYQIGQNWSKVLESQLGENKFVLYKWTN